MLLYHPIVSVLSFTRSLSFIHLLSLYSNLYKFYLSDLLSGFCFYSPYLFLFVSEVFVVNHIVSLYLILIMLVRTDLSSEFCFILIIVFSLCQRFFS